jgi:uncharacterized protein (DUF1330 family)
MSTPRIFVGADRPNVEALAAFGADPTRGPVVMLNLIKLRTEGGLERYAEYGAAVAPLLERVGGRLLHAGRAGDALIGAGDWDLVLLVEYPSHRAFLEMVLSSDYAAIAQLRTESLERSELHPVYPEQALDLGAASG